MSSATENMIEAAIANKVKRVVCPAPIRLFIRSTQMGRKAMMEKVPAAASRNFKGTGTVACGTRYGNVMAQWGSVIPLFGSIRLVPIGSPNHHHRP